MICCLTRVATLPVMTALRVLLWCGMYILQHSKMLCVFIVRMIILLLVIGFVTRLGDGEQLIKILVVSFVIFLIPQA